MIWLHTNSRSDGHHLLHSADVTVALTCPFHRASFAQETPRVFLCFPACLYNCVILFGSPVFNQSLQSLYLPLTSAFLSNVELIKIQRFTVTSSNPPSMKMLLIIYRYRQLFAKTKGLSRVIYLISLQLLSSTEVLPPSYTQNREGKKKRQ